MKTLPGVFFYKASDRVKRGIPDVICCVSGLFIAFELKRSDKEKATPLQAFVLNEILKAEGLAFTANPQNWPGIFATIKQLAESGQRAAARPERAAQESP